jgi:hypothetical protein
MPTFAAYIPVGPSPLDEQRVGDLLDSLSCHEPSVEAVVLVDNGFAARDLKSLIAGHIANRVVVLRGSKQDHTVNWLGVSSASTLRALDYLYAHVAADFIVRFDTDALVIGPFAERIAAAFAKAPTCGMLGTLGHSCNPSIRIFFDSDVVRVIAKALGVARKVKERASELDNIDMVHYSLFYDYQVDAFLSVCRDLEGVIDSSFDGRHCQGGAYAVSRETVARLKGAGYLENVDRWSWFPMAEDRLMGTFCWLQGLSVQDCSDRGQPFGVQAEGLAYPPDELLRRGYGIIHSVRHDRRLSEADIRAFFAARRTATPATH